MAKIQLNGGEYEISSRMNLVELLKKLKISSTKVAVEINGIIVDKDQYEKRSLHKDDQVEIVHFIGGG